jgi:hypothetical protein
VRGALRILKSKCCNSLRPLIPGDLPSSLLPYNSIKSFVIETFGEDKWKAVVEKLGQNDW